MASDLFHTIDQGYRPARYLKISSNTYFCINRMSREELSNAPSKMPLGIRRSIEGVEDLIDLDFELLQVLEHVLCCLVPTFEQVTRNPPSLVSLTNDEDILQKRFVSFDNPLEVGKLLWRISETTI